MMVVMTPARTSSPAIIPQGSHVADVARAELRRRLAGSRLNVDRLKQCPGHDQPHAAGDHALPFPSDYRIGTHVTNIPASVSFVLLTRAPRHACWSRVFGGMRAPMGLVISGND